MSSLRGWWAEGDGRLVRTYALALGVAIAADAIAGGREARSISASRFICSRRSPRPVMFFGGLLFGYGMVLSNGCGSRALVLLGRGNLRSFVVVIVLGIFAEMTLKGLIAPARIAAVQVSQITATLTSVPALLSSGRPRVRHPRALLAASVIERGADHLRVRASAVPAIAGPDRRRSPGRDY